MNKFPLYDIGFCVTYTYKLFTQLKCLDMRRIFFNRYICIYFLKTLSRIRHFAIIYQTFVARLLSKAKPVTWKIHRDGGGTYSARHPGMCFACDINKLCTYTRTYRVRTRGTDDKERNAQGHGVMKGPRGWNA